MIFRSIASIALACTLTACSFAQGWYCIGGGAQHNGSYLGTSQTMALIKWQTPLEDSIAYMGTGNGEHIAAPMITPKNTVIYGYEFTKTVNGSNSYDNWRVIARNGATGNLLWQFDTDYSAMIVFPAGWSTTHPMTLYSTGPGSTSVGLAAAGGSGSVFVFKTADSAAQSPSRYVFYTTAADFAKNQSAYAPIKIDTPITSDASGNLYFGYQVTGSIPANVSGSLGSGGVVKVNAATGAATYKSMQTLAVDSNLVCPGYMCAPALTTDGKYIYYGMTGGDSQLVKLDTATMSVAAHVLIVDPSNGGNASIITSSSACPMVAPDGHVFLGVFGNQYRQSHGWTMQYDQNLSPTDANGVLFPSGAFGWDTCVSIVPSSIVPSYKGKAKYLILTKYNNYDAVDFGSSDVGADGQNKVAIQDPTSNIHSIDRQSSIPVMDVIMSVVGITKNGIDSNHPDSVDEWCINSAAIDINKRSAILNSEDGHVYRWNFLTGALSESVNLNPATSEPYTETAIGPDGQSYIMNNSILYAVGSNKATSLTLQKGLLEHGSLPSIWSVDGASYMARSVSTSAGQTVSSSVTFTLASPSTNSLNVVAYLTAATGSTATVTAYNNVTKAYDVIAGPALMAAGQNVLRGSTTANVSDYIGKNGVVKIVLQVLNGAAFTESLDFISCGTN